MLKNMHGGPVARVNLARLIDLLGKENETVIHQRIAHPEVAGMMVFTVEQLDSSYAGHRRGLIYGPACTYHTIDEIIGHRLGDVPSRFAYASHLFVKESYLLHEGGVAWVEVTERTHLARVFEEKIPNSTDPIMSTTMIKSPQTGSPVSLVRCDRSKSGPLIRRWYQPFTEAA